MATGRSPKTRDPSPEEPRTHQPPQNPRPHGARAKGEGWQVFEAFLAISWGVILLLFHGSGRLTGSDGVQYVDPSSIFPLLTLVGGLGMIGLGAFVLLTRRPTRGNPHPSGEGDSTPPCCDHDHDHHDHDHSHAGEPDTLAGKAALAALFLLPFTLAAAFTPDNFSPEFAANKARSEEQYGQGSNRSRFGIRTAIGDVQSEPSFFDRLSSKLTGNPLPSGPKDVPGSTSPSTEIPGDGAPQDAYEFTMEDLERQVPKDAEGNFLLEVPDIYYTVGDDLVKGLLEGQPVATVAQIMPERGGDASGRRLRIFRLFIECCAADARPYSIPIEFSESPPEYREMGWVKVVGTLTYTFEGGQDVPLIRVSRLEETAPPARRLMF